jgi:hypothetical protein
MAVGGWVFLNTSPAAYLAEYGYDAPTYGDSTGAGIPLTGFQVIAHTADPFVFWISGPASGFSIDNLAPATPLLLMAQQQAVDIELNWSPSGVNESDFSHYAIYRSNSPGVAPGPSTLLTTTPDTSQTDSSPGSGTYFYVVTSVDVNENESEPSNEASVAIVTGVRDVPSITPDRLTLMPSYPNPFTDATTLRFGVPAADDVTIEVFDVAGRRVFEDRVRISAKGWYTYSISARTSSGSWLPSGVYMYRISTPQYVQSNKFIVTR